ncbi:MAG TPA: STAS domain-containing protein [Chloroflexus aurantiacus]|jgi:anti-anti-sigma regulatory factor/PAS domain-containing protein|uniref:Sulfate transporter/antisigma-factor antagonist STAS n=2 Tax=Chloroflexus TaxID=1107 RepID=A9WBR8_CHLAA|nr:STAS domain-containing protein [Chloroflexus aurantiacus]ABY34875.1 Sulfate transporter/antisigma-factor antagonist STAS [Chloroflexus aurantiacus J-10-fl]RMG46924.1 MAG: STAS domain-containing protein [Chloroflexota bacterium]GIV92779.1 MAG: anti-sigma factor antagonist [Chloroflexus sp.]HBW69009.1 STAS domain-containing protein [Chloroflexus aurantiacus]
MELLAILFTIVILVASIVYVLLQDYRATANRIFALFTTASLLLSCAGAVRFASRSQTEIWLLSGLLTSLQAATFGLLIWLILILFMPHRYNQPAIRWATISPYMVMAIGLAIDWYGRFGFVGRDVFREESGILTFVRGPAFWPVFALYIIGCIVIPVTMLVTLAVRHPAVRSPTIWLTTGTLLTLVTGYFSREIGLTALTYASLLPIHLSFGWVTIKYGLFRPSQVALQAAVEHLPDGVLVLDAKHRVRFANRAAQQLVALEIGCGLEEVLHEAGFVEQNTVSDHRPGYRRFVRGNERVLLLSEVVIRDERGGSSVVLLRDVTIVERQQAELLASQAILSERSAALERSLAELRQRDELLRRLTLPIIPLSSTTLVVPLIGMFDAERCQTLVQLILNETAARQVRVVLIDVTGLTVFDQTLAHTLNQLNQGARLMGAQIVLCGIRPDLAEVMIHTGSMWDGIRSFATLQDGVSALLVAR